MARKRKRARSSGGNRQPKHARNHKSRTKDSLPTGHSSVQKITPTLTVSTEYDLSIRSLRTQSNLLHVGADMRLAEVRGEKLTYTQACENRGVSPHSRHKHYKKLFYKDSSGQIHARKSDPYAWEFTLPTTRPDVFVSVTARGNVERSLTGRWLNAIKSAGDGNFDLIRDFPKGVFIDGKRLATGPFEVQRILEALEQSETAFEQQYYGTGGAR